MHYKLLGFSHKDSVRQFLFERIEIGVDPVRFTVIADIMIARSFNLSLQQLPSLCARLLQAAGEDESGGTLFLTETDMRVYAAENAVVAEQDAARGAVRSHQAALARKLRNEKRVNPADGITTRATGVVR